MGLVLFSIGMRSVFSPFILASQINALKMQLLAPEMAKLRADLMDAHKARDKAKIKAANEGMQVLKIKYNINTGLGIIPLFQVPFVIYFFWTLQDMVYEIDRFPNMTTDGFLWFKNLSEADPYFVLPVLFAFTTFYSIHKNPATSQVAGPAAKYMKYVKYLTFIGIPITASFPSAIVLNWFIMSFFQLLINSVVYTRTGKRIIRIPQYLPGSMLEKLNTTVKNPVFKPVVLANKPNITKSK